MKNKLREQIKDLANKILNSGNEMDTHSLKQTSRELYEGFSVLEYLEKQVNGEENNEDNNVNQTDSMDSKSFREENWFTEPEPVPQPQHEDDLIEPLMEKIKDIVAQMPKESARVDELLEEILPKKKYIKNDLEEFASNYQQTPTFERKQPAKGIDVKHTETKSEPTVDQKTRSRNDNFQQSLNIGLNDRLAFIKHLFNGSAEDYTRVLSQINTITNFDEVQDFIKGQVKPDYNNWLNKDEYANRFMSIIEKRYN